MRTSFKWVVIANLLRDRGDPVSRKDSKKDEPVSVLGRVNKGTLNLYCVTVGRNHLQLPVHLCVINI